MVRAMGGPVGGPIILNLRRGQAPVAKSICRNPQNLKTVLEFTPVMKIVAQFSARSRSVG